ncbi:hypothetical protein ASG73_08960 [Janibacter sp. Soil728]|uniref:hypothetical protein n=1 Tax=Janibacter sp. Soil728 TaxID=1736393 RepID=UPI0006FE6ACC|nr:hypothetical protein [Janibacter sp. Soil728]KRE37760.1 hypothetical protein ASG73_08960 [Janibacter sp. Soil728]
MGWVLALTLVVGLDAALSGYRAVQGRSGRLPSRRRDLTAHLTGLRVGIMLLAVPVVLGVMATSEAEREAVARAGVLWSSWLALPTVLALLVLLTLTWRWRYLATALVLGPMTWLRPVAAVMAGVAGAAQVEEWPARAAVLLTVVAVLAVEPVVGRVSYCSSGERRRDPGDLTGLAR